MADLKELEAALGVDFRDRSLLQRALTHRSYLNENPEYALPHNERLEFLGEWCSRGSKAELRPQPEGRGAQACAIQVRR